MVKYILICLLTCCCYSWSTLLHAQIKLFEPLETKKSNSVHNQPIRLELNPYAFRTLKKSADKLVDLILPFTSDENHVLQLRQAQLFDPEGIIRLRHQDYDEIIDPADLTFFTGSVVGMKKSLVALTISDDQVMGVISFKGTNWNLERDYSQQKKSVYWLYPEQPRTEKHYDCMHVDSDDKGLGLTPAAEPIEHVKKAGNQMMSSVDLYIECDHIMYQDFGNNAANVINYTTGLLNTVNAVYNMSNIDLNITQIDVWATPDPYDAASAISSGELLNKFKCHLDGNYNGRIAHLLSTVNQFGGIANRRSSCPYDKPLYAFSRIFTSYNSNLSNYSWSVNVIAHEIGHNLSSKHTHACAWYGNGTQIDDCSNVRSVTNNNDTDCDGIIDNIEEAEGSGCFDPNAPLLPTKGTIMSYCHVTSGIGIDLSQGFHPEVTTKMKSFIDNCMTPTVTVHCAIVDPSDIIVTQLGPNELELSCSRIVGIDQYAWRFTVNEACYDGFTVVSPTNTVVINNVLSDKEYEIICIVNCDSSPVWGDWSCPIYYTTDPCIEDKSLSGPFISDIKYEDAFDQIDSWEMIQDTAEVHYYFGSQAILHPGFSVEKASVFLADTTSCL